ncbi:GDSL-type esterase/lipase family protein [Gorillibacterium massiliense]|uniref:GDSL-type esterase/lipase family protein n=1 Tax=Gorillibacterium massiliense TaxID=1280390 RepID=UPI001EE16F3F|nr:GDSL-type esterase/lipase family protein [Gorillibacterium massiliense]
MSTPISAAAAGTTAAPAAPKASLNNTPVKDASLLSEAGGRTYLSVPYFTSFYGIAYKWDDKTKKLTVDGKAVSEAYGKPVVLKGILRAPLRALIEAYGGSRAEIGFDAASKTTNAVILPDNVVRLTASEAKIGERWASPIDAPNNLVYGVSNGKLIFVEYSVDGKVETAKKLSELPVISVPIPAVVNHTEIDWKPNGHAGNSAAHTDVRLVFVSRAEQDKIPAAPAAKTLVALGDSIAFGYNLQTDSRILAPNSFPFIAGNTIKYQTVNLGVSGMTSEGLLTNLAADSIRRSLAQADTITLTIGSNDIMGLARSLGLLSASNLSPVFTQEDQTKFDAASDQLKINLGKIIDTLKTVAPKSRIVVFNLYDPVPSLYTDLFKMADPLILKQNTVVTKVAKDKKVQVFDAYSVINGKQRELMIRQDVHPNAKGHEALGKALADVLSKPWQP